MLIGVLHLRLEAGNGFSFGLILWNRVRRCHFSLSVMLSANLCDYNCESTFVPEGSPLALACHHRRDTSGSMYDRSLDCFFMLIAISHHRCS